MEANIQDTTNFTPLAVGLLLVMVYLTWQLPRRLAACPLLAMVCLIPLGQTLVLFGMHFQLFRILLLVGVARVVARGEAARMKFNRLDKLFLWWVLVSVVFGTMAQPSLDLFVSRLGEAYNAVGCYFFVRCVVVDFEDIVTCVRALAVLSLPVATFMVIEKETSRNLLSVFGGVPAITIVREGHLRCQGAFRHPILAGTFGATQIPLFVALWFLRPQLRQLAASAIIASLIIVVTASSSGALMALFAGIAGLALWKWRSHMRVIRWGAVVAILGMAMVMNAPVWYLFAKLGNVTGGTGWHRAWLIDQAISHFDEWWLFGTTYTAHWGPGGLVLASDPNNMDITNQFVWEGVQGGMLRLVLFLAVIVQRFRVVGRQVLSEAVKSPHAALFIWALGVSLFAHCLSFMSVTYFDQIIVLWFWLLAIVSSFAGVPAEKPAPLGTVQESASPAPESPAPAGVSK